METDEISILNSAPDENSIIWGHTPLINKPFIGKPSLFPYTVICDEKMSLKSEYQVLTKVDDCVFLIDLHGDKSLTNDAERVTKELFEKYGNARFIYKDSLGVWDELMHD